MSVPEPPPVGVSARIFLDGLGAFEAAARGYSPATAIRPVRRYLRGLDDDQVRAAAVVLAVEGVWSLPGWPVRDGSDPMTDVELTVRQQQVRDWVDRRRLEATWMLG